MYSAFCETPRIEIVRDPVPGPGAVVIRVRASGICLSDWHGWMGHDKDITLPHVPGHELAGVVEAVGEGVTRWKPGDRVTVPFVGGCGACPQCETGNQQVCDNQFQPGFTHWGSFAELVAVHYADINLVALPEEIDFVTAASLGCRFATAFRAVVDQGRAEPGDWVAVHGCGGVGLSAIMIARALGARVLALDISTAKLALARKIGAEKVLNVKEEQDPADAIQSMTSGGPGISLDAIGNSEVIRNSIRSLAKRGRHVQVGLIPGETEGIDVMGTVIAKELEIVGSHGMQAHRYGKMLEMIREGRLNPQALIGREISLEESIEALTTMDRFENPGVTVITRF